MFGYEARTSRKLSVASVTLSDRWFLLAQLSYLIIIVIIFIFFLFVSFFLFFPTSPLSPVFRAVACPQQWAADLGIGKINHRITHSVHFLFFFFSLSARCLQRNETEQELTTRSAFVKWGETSKKNIKK